MRPVRLDIEGFASFREPTHIDFTDVDYFSLVGPTGSGKSTIIDAITFALYGTAHRWERSNAVAYALAPTSNRCTVSLIFDVSGQRYQAVREVRRVGQNVQQRTARLERFTDPTACPAPGDPAPDTVVLASEVRDMTPTVADLLGLAFDDFCQCVVLPQGEFARFLKAKSSERQAILLKLLGAGHYEQIGKAAGTRARDAEKEADGYTQQLGELAGATPQALAEVTETRDRLARLEEQVPGLVNEVLAARKEQTDQHNRHTKTAAAANTLAGLQVPDGLTDRHADLVIARGAHSDATARAQEAATDLADAIAAQDDGPQRSALEAVECDYAEQEQVVTALAAAQKAAEDSEADERDKQQEADQAATALREARTLEEQARELRDATATVVDRLTGLVNRMRTVAAPTDLDEIAAEANQADAAMTKAEQGLQSAKDAATLAAAACEGLPDPRTLTALEDDLDTLIERVRDWAADRDRLTELENAVIRTQESLTRAATARDAAWSALEEARAADHAAALRPTLTVGHACPVCTQTVAELPPPAGTTQLVDKAETAWQQAKNDHDAAEDNQKTASEKAGTLRERTATQRTNLTDQVHQLSSRLAQAATDAGVPLTEPLAPDGWTLSVDTIATFGGRVAAALTTVRQRCTAAFGARNRAVDDADTADKELEDARRKREAIQQRADKVRTGLARSHAGVDADGAPPVSSDTLTDAVAGWRALEAWCRETGDQAETELLPAARAADDANQTHNDALATLTNAETAAKETSEDARKAAQQAEGDRRSAKHLNQRRTELEQQLAHAAPLADLPDLLARADRLADQRKAALTADQEARQAHQDTDRQLRGANSAVTVDRDALGEARDRVAASSPPTFDGTRLAEDLAGCWADLVAWAQEAALRARDDAAAAEEAAARAGLDADRRLDALKAELAAHDLPTDEVTADPRAAERLIAVAHTKADGQVKALTKDRARVADLEEKKKAATERAQVAGELRSLLRSDNFGQWLATAALDTLVVGASDGLRQLSDGQFTLTHDKGDFFVIDHFDADSSRSVKTLSGGETFQASLALALALSEQLAALAIGGSARLDSIFLDEGFGTLDPESLETVAATLETLAQGDRMVGVVTHVAALAERTPVRFSVSHDNRTSRIEREAL